MDEENHLLIILHQPPSPEEDEIRKAILFWQDHEDNGATRNPAASRRWNVISRVMPTSHTLDDQVEAAKTPRDYFEVMKRTNPLLRAARNQLNVLEDARQARPNHASSS